ncbi:coiled-coil domain-containing protein 125 isoform X2 [Antennarius striatus]|uniref:coiled-coil domain-containing protein 125 isoform X2 n=1 Tax=Antennarius striatus TaxID=241820 RepID=UPI0035AF1807
MMMQINTSSETCSPVDDMVDGDLGDGMEVRAASRSTRKKSQSFAGATENLLPGTEWLKRSGQPGEAGWIPVLKVVQSQQKARWKLSSSESLVDLSKDDLKGRLQEAAEVIDALCCDLEVTHRYLEGKYEALKILQGKAILDKATSHTKILLQKSEERVRALEKEVNSLQWELSFNQVQMKRSQQSLEQKYNRLDSGHVHSSLFVVSVISSVVVVIRILNENKTLADNLDDRETELQQLRAENSALNQQYLELLSMLNVKEQRVYQGTKPQYHPEKDASVLELAVMGACRCVGVAEACPCSRTAAASRKQLAQLRQELDAQCSRREEALMVADAFRIAFEQQLRKRSDHFLLLAENNILKSHHDKAEGANRSPLISVSQKLRGLLPSSLDGKTPDDLLATLYRLLDLLNDKEEALAHQRKVSIMLAHSAEELQRKLHQDAHVGPPDPPQSRTPSDPPQTPPENQSQPQTPDPSESSNKCHRCSTDNVCRKDEHQV